MRTVLLRQREAVSEPTGTRHSRGCQILRLLQTPSSHQRSWLYSKERRRVVAPQATDDSSPSTSTSYAGGVDQSFYRAPVKTSVASVAVAALPTPALPLTFAERAGIRDAAGRLMLKNLTLPELEEWCFSVGEPAKRAKQLYRWLYGNRKWIRSLDSADGDPHSFGAPFKAKIAASASLSGGLQLQSVHTARDGTRKLVFALVDEGEAAVGTTAADGSAAVGRLGAMATAAAAAAAGTSDQGTDPRVVDPQAAAHAHRHQHDQQEGLSGRSEGAAAAGVGGGTEGAGGAATSGGRGGAGRSVAAGGGLTTRGTVETVLIPMTNRSGKSLRYTACLSTQVGCAMNCQFCYTGRMGLLGNLSTAQIIEQVVEARRYLADQAVDIPIANIVFMGMGEPLHNYDAVMAAIEILAVGLELSRNKIIVSTVGLVPEMTRFIESKAAKLAVSLHATTDEVRDWIVPTNRRYPLEELLGALRRAFPYDAATRRNANGKSDDFVVIEYVLLAGVNDTVEDAERLVALTSDIYCIVNLIVFNPHEGTAFERSSDEAVRAFRDVFAAAGRLCTVRASKGDDEMAACGQLGDVSISSRPAPMLRPPEGLAERLAAMKKLQEQGQGQAVLVA